MRTYTAKEVETLLGVVECAAQITNHTKASSPQQQEAVDTSEQVKPPESIKLLLQVESIRKAWDRDGPTICEDASGADLRILTVMERHAPGFMDDPSQVEELIYAFRRHHGADPKKARRKDYISRTIAAAKRRLSQGSTDVVPHTQEIPDGWYLPLGEFLAKDESDNTPQWVVERILEQGGLGILGASPKNLKSVLMVDLSLSVASGLPFMNRFPVGQEGTVVYLAAEDNKRTVRRRIRMIARGKGITNLEDLEIVVSCRAGIQLSDTNWIRELEKLISRYRPVLVIVDTLRAVFGGDENSSSEARGLVHRIQPLRDICGSAIMFTHHHRKNQNGDHADGPGLQLRGSGDWHAAAESLLGLSRKMKLSDTVVTTSIQAEHRDGAELDPYFFTVSFEGDRIVFAEAESKEESRTCDILGALENAAPNGLTTSAIHKAVGGNRDDVLKLIKSLIHDRRLVPAPGQKDGLKRGVRYICAPSSDESQEV